MSSSIQSISGHCLCQKVSFQFENCSFNEAGQVCICHCKMCRHAFGATAPVAMALPLSKLSFGEDHNTDYPPSLKEYQSSKNTTRLFCSTCGSTLLFRYAEEASTIWVYVATLDDDLQDDPALKQMLANPKVACHIFATDKAGWYDLHNPDGLPVGDQLELWKCDSC